MFYIIKLFLQEGLDRQDYLKIKNTNMRETGIMDSNMKAIYVLQHQIYLCCSWRGGGHTEESGLWQLLIYGAC